MIFMSKILCQRLLLLFQKILPLLVWPYHTKSFLSPVNPLRWSLTWCWLHIWVFVSLCVDDHSSSHEWWEEGGNNRCIKLGDGDAGGKGHLLDCLCLHGGPEVLYIHLTGAQEFRPGELKGQNRRVQTAESRGEQQENLPSLNPGQLRPSREKNI